jgi:hypothetical protein
VHNTLINKNVSFGDLLDPLNTYSIGLKKNINFASNLIISDSDTVFDIKKGTELNPKYKLSEVANFDGNVFDVINDNGITSDPIISSRNILKLKASLLLKKPNGWSYGLGVNMTASFKYFAYPTFISFLGVTDYFGLSQDINQNIRNLNGKMNLGAEQYSNKNEDFLFLNIPRGPSYLKNPVV